MLIAIPPARQRRLWTGAMSTCLCDMVTARTSDEEPRGARLHLHPTALEILRLRHERRASRQPAVFPHHAFEGDHDVFRDPGALKEAAPELVGWRHDMRRSCHSPRRSGRFRNDRRRDSGTIVRRRRAPRAWRLPEVVRWRRPRPCSIGAACCGGAGRQDQRRQIVPLALGQCDDANACDLSQVI